MKLASYVYLKISSYSCHGEQDSRLLLTFPFIFFLVIISYLCTLTIALCQQKIYIMFLLFHGCFVHFSMIHSNTLANISGFTFILFLVRVTISCISCNQYQMFTFTCNYNCSNLSHHLISHQYANACRSFIIFVKQIA